MSKSRVKPDPKQTYYAKVCPECGEVTWLRWAGDYCTTHGIVEAVKVSKLEQYL